jgi:hypothetical protein
VHVGNAGGIAEVEYPFGSIDIGCPGFLPLGTVKGQAGGTMDDRFASTVEFFESFGLQEIAGNNFGHSHCPARLFFPMGENFGDSVFGGLFSSWSNKNSDVFIPFEQIVHNVRSEQSRCSGEKDESTVRCALFFHRWDSIQANCEKSRQST